MRMCIKNKRWQPATLDFDVLVRYHAVPAGMELDHYIEKKKLLYDSIDTTEHLWEWHVFLTNKNKHAFLVRMHHVIGDGLSLVKLVIHSFDADLPKLPKVKKTVSTGTTPGSPVTPKGGSRDFGGDNASDAGSTSSKGSNGGASGSAPKKANKDFLNSGRKKKLTFCQKAQKTVLNVVGAFVVLISFFPLSLSIMFMRPDRHNVFRSSRRHISKSMSWIRPCKTEIMKGIGKNCRGSINDVLCAILAGGERANERKWLQSPTHIHY